MWANADSWQYYPWIGVNEEHHELSHAGDEDAAAREKLVKINAWHSEQVKYILDQLALAREVDGSSVRVREARRSSPCGREKTGNPRRLGSS